MRKIIWTLSFIVFVISAAWAIHSGMDYEPTIAFVSSIITIVTLYFTSEKVAKKENKIVIKGKKNKVKQINFDSKSQNSVNIDGDSNDVSQF